MTLELIRFEGAAPVTQPVPPSTSAAAQDVLRARSAGTRLRSIPATVTTAGRQAIQSVARTFQRRRASDAELIEIRKPADAAAFVEATGARLKKNVIYARHPKLAKNDTLIAAPAFHQHVIKEQIAEIVRYLRSELHMTSVRITVRSEKSGKIVVGSTLKGVPILAKLGMQADQSVTLEQRSHKPRKVSSRDTYLWIDDFPEIRAAAKSARHGTFRAVQSVDMNFGLSAQAARLASIGADWLSTFEFIVEAEYS